MEHEISVENDGGEKKDKNISFVKNNFLPIMILFSSFLISGSLIYSAKYAVPRDFASADAGAEFALLEKEVLPKSITLPISWKDLGSKMVKSGVIDEEKMRALYEQRGGWSEEYRTLLTDEKNGKIVITRENAGYWLNLLWAFGLANKNDILETGEMSDPKYGGAENFASTGGWELSKGNSMKHYSRHEFVILSDEQQKLIDKISQNIYRPCCGNSTHFPDCNHGMAMLGLLELLASQGVGETEMYKIALAVNSYWFPDTYITIAKHMQDNGIKWKEVSSQSMLGFSYSSASGYKKISEKVTKPDSAGGGSGCSV